MIRKAYSTVSCNEGEKGWRNGWREGRREKIQKREKNNYKVISDFYETICNPTVRLRNDRAEEWRVQKNKCNTWSGKANAHNEHKNAHTYNINNAHACKSKQLHLTDCWYNIKIYRISKTEAMIHVGMRNTMFSLVNTTVGMATDFFLLSKPAEEYIWLEFGPTPQPHDFCWLTVRSGIHSQAC